MRVWQEFHCTKSGGGCGGYILIKLNTALNYRVNVVCPKCKHVHPRSIVNGVIHEQGRFNGSIVEDITPTMGAWSDKPHSKKMNASIGERRDGVPIGAEDLHGDSPSILGSLCAYFKGQGTD